MRSVHRPETLLFPREDDYRTWMQAAGFERCDCCDNCISPPSVQMEEGEEALFEPPPESKPAPPQTPRPYMLSSAPPQNAMTEAGEVERFRARRGP